MCAITTTSLLIPLSWLVGIGNFCFNLLSSFLSIVYILSCQSIWFRIVLYAFFLQFPWSTFLPFPSYLKLHDLMYLGVDVSTDGTTIQSYTTLNYHTLDFHNNTDLMLKNISQHSIDQFHLKHHTDHTTSHPMQPHLIHISNYPTFATVQLNWSNTTDKSYLVVSKINPAFQPTHYQFLHSLPQMLLHNN